MAAPPRLEPGNAGTPPPARSGKPDYLTALGGPGLSAVPPGSGSRRQNADILDRNNAGLRTAAADHRRLTEQLRGLPEGDPRRAQAQADLQRTERTLGQYGYTGETVPKPGALWLDPQFNGVSRFTANEHPTGTPVTKPPEPMDALFHGGRSVNLIGADGKPQTVRSPEEYRQVVASNRAAAGMPVKDGEPVAVQLNLQGGGGTGKNYAALSRELLNQGVVPTSVSGTSAGSIGAAMIAAGADPRKMQEIVTHPELAEMMDLHGANTGGGGLASGKRAYDFVDRQLRELTGITDRPVTFADLKMPLQIVATKWTDSNPDTDMTTRAGRTFVFSQENTPDTPVALAVRASMSIPAVFDPVKMQDPMTGRRIDLVDGGMVDNLPMNHGRNDLPQLGVSLLQQASAHPAYATGEQKLPAQLPHLDGQWVLKGRPGVSLFGRELVSPTPSVREEANDFNARTGRTLDDFRDRTHPSPGQHMLSLPVWNLRNPAEHNEITGFAHQPGVDERLSAQTGDVTRRFLRDHLDDLRVPGARSTNLAPAEVGRARFEGARVNWNGVPYDVRYDGGDSLRLTRHGQPEYARPTEVRMDGRPTPRRQLSYEVPLGRTVIEAIHQDARSFGGLQPALQHAFDLYQRSAAQRFRDDNLTLEGIAGFNPILGP
ncbi:MAG TPA: patatin-like phospholipase family protein [Longimicrobium sp.]|nr:patatin-like phospholipase family protein [Longimicrobium sp.]